MYGLRDDHDLVLQGPAQQHLGGRLAVSRRDRAQARIGQLLAARERAVRLELNAVRAAEIEQGALVQERAEFDLIDARRRLGGGHELLEMSDRVVAHADRAALALLAQLHQRAPGVEALA